MLILILFRYKLPEGTLLVLLRFVRHEEYSMGITFQYLHVLILENELFLSKRSSSIIAIMVIVISW